ncbi:MAG: CinA family protein [Bacilli bacterium]|nr:CinA family protein [Bacilli bacterium]
MNHMHDLLQNLADLGLTLGTVESMTGGLFAAKATDIPGASHVFKGAIVSYSAEVKEKTVGVDAGLIANNGVVSEPVAKEMAVKGREALGVDVCLSVTGNAGPSAEEGEAGVGQVYFSLATKDAAWTFGYTFEGTRQEIREAAVDMMVSFGLSQFPTPVAPKE